MTSGLHWHAAVRLVMASTLGLLALAAAHASEPPVHVYYFWGDGCPNCALEKPFLDELSERHPGLRIHDYDVWTEPAHMPLFEELAAAYGVPPYGVPATFAGDRAWVGFTEQIGREIRGVIEACLADGCGDPLALARSDAGPGERAVGVGKSSPATPPETSTLILPLIGEVDLAAHSLALSTGLIAFVDGFNPCSLWVLSLLLAIVIYSGSRRKVLVVGLTFLTITAGVYGLFITGLFSAFSYVAQIAWIQAAVALLALVFGAVNVKDYFWWRRGVSFTISDEHKPKIYKDIRRIMQSGESLPAMMGATALMALGITLVELPCTAGFPVIWSNILAGREVGTMAFAGLLGLYLVVYLLDELAVFGVAAFTLKATRFEETHGRVLKLIGGTIMLALAAVLLLAPELMNSVAATLAIFAGALAVSGLIVLAHRMLGGAGGRERRGAKCV